MLVEDILCSIVCSLNGFVSTFIVCNGFFLIINILHDFVDRRSGIGNLVDYALLVIDNILLGKVIAINLLAYGLYTYAVKGCLLASTYIGIIAIAALSHLCVIQVLKRSIFIV